MNAGTDALPGGISPERRAAAIEACQKLARTCLAISRLAEAIRHPGPQLLALDREEPGKNR